MDKATWNLVKILSSSHEVTFIVPVDPRYNPPEDIEKVRSICHRLVAVPVKNHFKAIKKSSFWYWWRFFRLFFLRPTLATENFYYAMARKVRELCRVEKYDLVQAVSLACGEYLRFARPVPTMILAHEAHFELTRLQFLFAKNLFRKAGLWLSYMAYLRYEPRIYRNCDRFLALSARDSDKIIKRTGSIPFFWLLPDPVEADDLPASVLESSLKSHDSYSLVFVGGLGPSFNQDAVLYFCREIFPLIRRRVPQAKFYIVGEDPPDHIKNLAKDDGIIVTGTVSDVRPYIARAAVYVAPIRYSGGVKSKIIEALSMGKAIVASSVAVEGLSDLGEGVFRIQDEPQNFADEVVRLLHSDELRISMGARARDLFERSYSLRAVTPQILKTYEEVKRSLDSTISKNKDQKKATDR
jgi:glycosyltransferase involved in cell wall biosynthesis